MIQLKYGQWNRYLVKCDKLRRKRPEVAISTDLCNFLKQQRKIIGLTIQKVADSVEIPRSTYVAYEKGKTRIPISVLTSLAKVLEVDEDILWELRSTIDKRKGA